MSDQLINALAELDEDFVINGVKELYSKGTPQLEILSLLQKGMEEVGRRFESNEYFLSELIMSGDIFKSATAIMGDACSLDNSASLGTIVMGTVKGDIHDIGKDIVVSILSCNGFKVIDLGVDVPAENFIEAVKEHNPEVIGMSCLLTSAFNSMKDIISSLEDAGLREGRKVLIGGGPIDGRVSEFVGADGYCLNAQEAVDACKKLVKRN